MSEPKTIRVLGAGGDYEHPNPNYRPKSELSPAPGSATCCTCGYSWPAGQDGSHSCAIVLEQRLREARGLLCLVWNHMHGENIDGTRRPWPGDEGCAANWNKLSDAIGTYLGHTWTTSSDTAAE